MYAVIETGGKQYRVKPGDVISVEVLPSSEEKVQFDKVLLVEKEGELQVGKPYLEKTQVIGEVIRTFKDKKVIVFKKKRRKQYRRWRGHRQALMDVRILEIRGLNHGA